MSSPSIFFFYLASQFCTNLTLFSIASQVMEFCGGFDIQQVVRNYQAVVEFSVISQPMALRAISVFFFGFSNLRFMVK
jgi:hypothetical protein